MGCLALHSIPAEANSLLHIAPILGLLAKYVCHASTSFGNFALIPSFAPVQPS